MADLKTTVGSRIRSLRRRLGLTQDEVAERAGIDPKSLSRIEGGKFNASLETLERVAFALNVEVAMLFSGATTTREETRNMLIDAAINSSDDELREIADFICKIRRRTERPI